MKTLFALAFLFCFSVAFALKCYSCTSSESLEACAKAQKEISCPLGISSCGTLDVSFKLSLLKRKQYAKGCFPESQCKNAEATVLKACKEAERAGVRADCKFTCCDKDLCNGASSGVSTPSSGASTPSSGVSAPMLNVVLMMACAFVTFWR